MKKLLSLAMLLVGLTAFGQSHKNHQYTTNTFQNISGSIGTFPFVTYSTNLYDVFISPGNAYNGRYQISVRDTVADYQDFLQIGGTRHLTKNDPQSFEGNWALSTATNSSFGDYELAGDTATPLGNWSEFAEGKMIGVIVTPVLLTNTVATNGYASFHMPAYAAATITTNLQVETWGSDVVGRVGYFPFRTVEAAIASTTNALPIFVGPGNFYDRLIVLRANQNLIGAGDGVTFFQGTSSVNPGHNTLLKGFSLIGNTGGVGYIAQNGFISATNVTLDSITVSNRALDWLNQPVRTNWTFRNCNIKNAGTIVGGSLYGVETWINCHIKAVTEVALVQDYAQGLAADEASVGTLRVIGGSITMTNHGNSSIYPSACIYNFSDNVTVEIYGTALIYSKDVPCLGFNNDSGSPARGYYSDNGNLIDLGTVTANSFTNRGSAGTATTTWTTASGSPEGVVTASIGSFYCRINGGAATTLYVKESGTGNTGWVAVGGGGDSLWELDESSGPSGVDVLQPLNGKHAIGTTTTAENFMLVSSLNLQGYASGGDSVFDAGAGEFDLFMRLDMQAADFQWTGQAGGGTHLLQVDDTGAVTRSGISPSTGDAIEVTAAGTVPALSDAEEVFAFGTTTPVTPSAMVNGGSYLVTATGVLRYNGATYAAPQTVTVRLKDGGGVTIHSQVIQLRILTTTTDDAGTFSLVAYVPDGDANDLSLTGQLSATPSAGSVECTAAKIVAVRVK